MAYRFTKNDIRVTQNASSLTLSTMLGEQYISHTYMGYSMRDAMKKFQQDFGTYPKNHVPIGVLPLNNHGGLAIMEIENGIEDYAYVCANCGNGYTNLSKAKICYTKKGEPYFLRHGNKYYLNQFITHYSDKIYGGRFTYEEMVEDAKKNYDYGDPTNCLTYMSDWWKENYKIVK